MLIKCYFLVLTKTLFLKISALRSSKLSEEERPGYEANVIFLRHLVEKLFTAIEEFDNFETCTQKYLSQRTNQYMSRIYTREGINIYLP